MKLAQEIRAIIEAPEVMEKGLVDEVESNDNEIEYWACDDRFVKNCKLNILKHDLCPDDISVYCGGMACDHCPLKGKCDNGLSKQIPFMQAVVDAAERDIG